MNGKKVFWLAVVGACSLGIMCPGAWAWRTDIKEGAASAVTLDAAGDVVAAGVTSDIFTRHDFAVIKLSGASGTELWRQEINGTTWPASDSAAAVTVDAAGDVVAAGSTLNSGTYFDFTVIKFDGADGRELWRRVIDGDSPFGVDRAVAVTVDGNGDVVTAGRTVDEGTDADFTVIKLSGADGTDLWRHVINGGVATAVAVDAEGEVVAAGSAGSGFTVIKLAGASGEELWRAEAPGWGAFAVAVDAAGDVVAAGSTWKIAYEFTVIKLSGADGTELWRQEINSTPDSLDQAGSVTVDGAGDVVAAGSLNDTGTSADFTVVKFDGVNGKELWRRTIKNGVATAVAVDAEGEVVAAGETSITDEGSDFTVLKLGGLDSGKKLLVSDKEGDPAKRRLAVVSGDPGIVAATPESPGDPTIGGALLEVINPTTGETDTFTLPAANWSGLGRPPGSKGYKYIDRTLAAGPCKKVLIKAGRQVKASCKGAGIAFSLDEASQGSLGVRLTTGAGSLRYCMLFGGTILKDTPATGGETGVFMAKDAPPPAACPGAP